MADKGETPADPTWDDLTGEQKQQLLEMASGNVTRRDVLTGAAALGTGAVVGGGASQAMSERAAASHNGGTIGTASNPMEMIHTEGLSNTVEFIRPSDTFSDINSKLSSPGTYVFESGTHTLQDRIEPSADGVEIIIPAGATVTWDDSASPTSVTDDTGNEKTMMFYVDSVSDFTFRLRGEVDGNNANHTRSIPLFLTSVTDGFVNQDGGQWTDVHTAAFFVDSTDLTAPNLWTDDITASVATGTLGMEGCEGCRLGRIGVVGDKEALDFNASCSDIEVDTVWSRDGGQTVDINQSGDITIGTIVNHGANPDNLLKITGTQGPRFTEKSRGNSDNITVKTVKGTSTGPAVSADPAGGGSIKNLHLMGLNITSTTTHALFTLASAAGDLDGLRVEGTVRSEDTANGTGKGWQHESNGNPIEGVSVDLNAYSESNAGVNVKDISNFNGEIHAIGCGSYGAIIGSTNSNTVAAVNLSIVSRNNGSAGVLFNNNGSDVTDVTVRGIAVGNGTNDVSLNGGTTYLIDMDYGTIHNSASDAQEAQYSALE